jgi:hypothetical protein
MEVLKEALSGLLLGHPKKNTYVLLTVVKERRAQSAS